MGFTMPSPLGIAGILAAGVGLLLQIVGLATEFWVSVTFLGTTIHAGLWCPSGATCNEPDFLLACRAFGIIGVLLLAACAGCGVLMCFQDNNKMPLLGAISGVAAGVSIVIEFAVYAGEIGGSNWGYSFYLTIAAAVLAFVAAVCFFVSKNRA